MYLPRLGQREVAGVIGGAPVNLAKMQNPGIQTGNPHGLNAQIQGMVSEVEL